MACQTFPLDCRSVRSSHQHSLQWRCSAERRELDVDLTDDADQLFLLRFIQLQLAEYGQNEPEQVLYLAVAHHALAGEALDDRVHADVDRLVGRAGHDLVRTALVGIFIILGMAGYFGAVSKAPLTAMILVTEMVGDLHQLMTIGVVTLIAYLVMDFMGGEPVYEAMLHNLIAHEQEQVDNIPTMIDLPVTDSLAGRLVKDLTLPDGVLISTQIFQDQSEVVHGDTRLKAGATLYLVVNESNISQVRKLFL